MWPICHNSRNEDPVQPKIKYKLIKNKKLWSTCYVEHTRSPSLRRLPEGGALAATPPHTLDRRALPSRWRAPGPSPRGTTRRTEDASGDRDQLSPPTSERQTGDAPTQQRESPRAGDAGRREASSAPCAAPAAGAPGGSGPRGSYCKAQSERLLKMFSGL